jgi:hypothetical protein
LQGQILGGSPEIVYLFLGKLIHEFAPDYGGGFKCVYTNAMPGPTGK